MKVMRSNYMPCPYCCCSNFVIGVDQRPGCEIFMRRNASLSLFVTVVIPLTKHYGDALWRIPKVAVLLHSQWDGQRV